MKKALALILALALVFALSINAFASESTHDSRTDPATFPGAGDDVYISAAYNHLDDQAPTVYYVTVAWQQEGTIQYENGYTVYKWNPTGENEMTYTVDRNVDGKWTIARAAVKVTVTNRSNADVYVQCSDIAPQGNVTEIQAGVTNQSFKLDSPAPDPAAVQASVPPTEETATYTINSVTGSIDTNEANIGKLTVSLSATAFANP